MKLEIIYDTKCKHCENLKTFGRGKPAQCEINAKPLFRGINTLACDKFKLK